MKSPSPPFVVPDAFLRDEAVVVGRRGRETRQRLRDGDVRRAASRPPSVAVFEPYDVVVPYSNHQSVAAPRGLTVPFSVADVPPTALTEPVIAVGAAAPAAGSTDERERASATARTQGRSERPIDSTLFASG